MSDPYRGLVAPETSRTQPSVGAEGGVIRPLLWTLLLLGAVCNMVSSSVGGAAMPVGIGFGVVTLACAAALVAHHRLRGRS